jgi:hypothetical protein
MFGIRGTGGGTDTAMFGFLATTFTIRTIMRTGFLVTGSTGVEGGIGLKVTGGIKTLAQIGLSMPDALPRDGQARSP